MDKREYARRWIFYCQMLLAKTEEQREFFFHQYIRACREPPGIQIRTEE